MENSISRRLSNASPLLPALALAFAGVCPAQSASSPSGKVTAVRFWAVGEVTRVSIEVSSDFKFKSDKLHDPERVFFDIQGAKPSLTGKAAHTITVGDGKIKQIRVAETQPGTTRVVLDLEKDLEYTASQLANPERLMIELRSKDKTVAPPKSSISGVTTIEPAAAGVTLASTGSAAEIPTEKPVLVQMVSNPVVAPEKLPPLVLPAAPVAAKPAPIARPAVKESERPTTAAKPVPEPAAAKHKSDGGQSLTRALGLKLGKIVIDPGHGGNDVGTHGPSGLYEKDLVLDVSQRLAGLLEDRMGSEVVLTRSTDVYIPLEERTRIANDHKADLFLSVHANSSPVKSVTGVETYYLNFATSKTALDLAARENATSQSSVFDLKDMLEKIALKDKIDESKEFAAKIQSSMFAAANKDKTLKDRGIKKAPFVVLIGAQMPSVLAEIGFLTNATDEKLMRKPEQRDKIAEALYKGIAAYADSLSHVAIAKLQ